MAGRRSDKDLSTVFAKYPAVVNDVSLLRKRRITKVKEGSLNKRIDPAARWPFNPPWFYFLHIPPSVAL